MSTCNDALGMTQKGKKRKAYDGDGVGLRRIGIAEGGRAAARVGRLGSVPAVLRRDVVPVVPVPAGPSTECLRVHVPTITAHIDVNITAYISIFIYIYLVEL